ncbi:MULTISPECIES: DUF4177 domain-containing protein [unclassified Paenibacillus]|uniref:DUF4177 domain-containing protein n=1 Tax=unclassified Paenibacillus TaxID=185978 RepID=UPI00020D79DE|nr:MULTISPECIES: DUF4177 domain-containing protein [unclassified Paenibacillus]EGL19764.1 hypothetical protein HMPREF9413_3567 [Paenibacillus sp. HGF7]EPD92236.1 hypothetical protein HMPREF1207_00902 [Paenibacillus sp. HGH0039]
MERWEYQTLKFFTKGFFVGGKLDLDEFDQNLNEMGAQGWELISCFDTSQYQGSSKEVICVFKRKLF